MFGDPKLRTAYVITKIGVFALAALATWPLARIIGPKAWWGLGVFGVLLMALAVAVLSASGRKVDPEDDSKLLDDEDIEKSELAVELPIEDVIDLHSFPPRDVPTVVQDYLEAAHAHGFREVRLIHGRGIGVQRERVRSVLSEHPLVEGFRDAPADRGGWGATIASLRR
jgi:dsDNA-specific endonuclease/ATPase MutS2